MESTTAHHITISYLRKMATMMRVLATDKNKDRWLAKTEIPEPTNKLSSARKTEPSCVDAILDDPRGTSS